MQNDYNFWADLFDTYQSLTVGLQTGWMLALLIFATIVTMIIGRQFDDWGAANVRPDEGRGGFDIGPADR